MNGAVLRNLEKLLKNREFMDTRRCQLDWERSSIVEYDDVTSREIIPNELGETDKINGARSIKQRSDELRKNPPLFRFFLDGSRRTFRIADVPFNTQCFPVIAGQVGVGVCERDEEGYLSQYASNMLFVLTLPSLLDTDGKKNSKSHDQFFDKLCDDVNTRISEGGRDFRLNKILYYVSYGKDDNYEDKAIAVIQDFMIQHEKEAVRRLVKDNCLDNDKWLLKDGSLEYARLADKNDPFAFSNIQENYRYVIGVSKSFNPELARTSKNKSASRRLAELREGERTPVFKYRTSRSDGTFAIWYLRLRGAQFGGGPFDGVVKIEKILIGGEVEDGIDTQLVDSISASVYNERNPVCYGKDNRWPNHLYPVFLTESLVKSRYLSTEYFVQLF